MVTAARAGRFHRGDEPEPTQYLSLHPQGPHAELLRANDLRQPEQVLTVRARTWALRIDLAGLLELTFDNAATFGIEPAGLVADVHEPCQALAERLRLTVRGLVVPSAALPGTRNVVVFGPRVATPYLAEPPGAVDVPAAATAEGGRAPVGLLPRVRFIGDPHAELDAWLRGKAFAFVEPAQS